MAGGHNGHDHTNGGGHSHDTGPIYKGLCGLLGIYFFFFTERMLTIFTDYKRKEKVNTDVWFILSTTFSRQKRRYCHHLFRVLKRICITILAKFVYGH
jgi:hypothetical protein